MALVELECPEYCESLSPGIERVLDLINLC